MRGVAHRLGLRQQLRQLGHIRRDPARRWLTKPYCSDARFTFVSADLIERDVFD
jgi:hypothetical protein